MEFSSAYAGREDEIVSLFEATFTASEGAAEGKLIGKLSRELLSTTPSNDLFAYSAWEDSAALAAILFSRLIYLEDPRSVFVLAPVAVATSHQGKGVGQALIKYGLRSLRVSGADIALTYGDINFYSKVGFATISEEIAKAPLALEYPEGWLGQTLSAQHLAPLIGPSSCVDALNSPDYW